MFYVDVPKVRGKMAEKGFTATSMAKALGVSRNTLSAYLSAPGKFPYDILEQMADTLFDSAEEAREILLAEKLTHEKELMIQLTRIGGAI